MVTIYPNRTRCGFSKLSQISLMCILSTILTKPAAADNLKIDAIFDGVSTIEYEETLPHTVGDSVHVSDLSSPLERCIEFEDASLLPDTNGSTQAQLSYRFLRDFRDYERTSDFSLNVHVSMKGGLGDLAKVGGSTTAFGRYNNFISTERESLMLVLRVTANHGRDVVRDFKVKDEYQSLQDSGNIEELLDRCGTHFIRGISRVSEIEVHFQFSNLDTTKKRVLEAKFESQLESSANFEVFDASSKTSVTTTIADTLNLGAKLGDVRYSIHSRGGLGIPTLTSALTGVNFGEVTAEQVASILQSLETAGKDFNRENSSPDKFILQRYGFASAEGSEFDVARFEKLGELYRALMSLDQQVVVLEALRDRDPQMWSRYFQVQQEKLETARTALYNEFLQCRNSGSCDTEVPSVVDGIILVDAFSPGELYAQCPHSLVAVDKINPNSASDTRALSSVIVSWYGKLKFSELIDLGSVELFRITPDFEKVKMPFVRNQQLRVTYNDASDPNLFLAVARDSVDQNNLVEDGELNYGYLQQVRRLAGRSVYILGYTTASGLQHEQALGYPNMQNCDLVE
ncbi:hypothetical protein [Ruegeria sp. HKCCA5014]|uniref:hypothetical protein n=1 Tax=Ruegeria sp. HKCCA5014 TaxID=2682980 RepID=UPI0014883080|nr:hypothetical protein [Ruegeria sp. HKCCA5014]